LLDQQETLS